MPIRGFLSGQAIEPEVIRQMSLALETFEHELAALLFELYGFRNNSGSLAIFAATAPAAW